MRSSSLLAALPVVVLSTIPLRAEPPVRSPAATTVTKPEPAAKAEARPVSGPRAAAPATTLRARIDLSAQRMDVSYDGKVQHSWPISSGREGYPTPRGSYRPQWTARMWYSRKYDNAPMPHAVFFTGGVAVHGTQATGLLGQPASHGCVRLAPANAARFYALVQKHGLKSTRIEVHGTPPPSRIARRAPAREMTTAGRRESRRVAASGYGWSWPAPWWVEAPAVKRRAPAGVIHLPPGSPLRGRSSFVLNGVTYVRVR